MRLALLNNLSLPRACLVALLAGALNVLSFAPFFIWPIQILSLALMFLLVVGHPDWNKKQVAKLGFCYAFGTMALGVSWLTIAMTRYGGMPWLLSILFVGLLAAYMALYIMAAFVLSRILQNRWRLSLRSMLLIALPALSMLCEFLRSYVFTGFPWLAVGYAHTVSPLAGFAPVIGVYGLAGLSAVIAGALVLLLVDTQIRWGATALIVAIFGAGFGLQQVEWTHAHGAPLSVRLAQGNIDQGEKFSVEFVDRTLQMYAGMITEQPADIIAVPETAIPILTSQLPPDYLPGLQSFAANSRSQVFVGVAIDDGDNKYANSVLGLGANSDVGTSGKTYRYDKHHLVPFGEFVPTGFRWFVNLMKIPLGEFSNPGVIQPAMPVKDQRVMPNICYEDLFGDEIAQQLRAQHSGATGAATILLNMSNLAWYGDSIAMPQHLQISQMRALETGRPMLRSTNTGATAIIDSKGKVQASLPFLVKGSLSGQVQGMQGLTPYIRFGDAPALLVSGMALLALSLIARRRQS